MTGNDIFDIVVSLLGYTDFSRKLQDSSGLKERTLCAINQITNDLCGAKAIDNLFDEIPIDDASAAATPYGVAMLLSLIDGDSDKNAVFSSIYNAKRAAAKGKRAIVSDVLPKGGDV